METKEIKRNDFVDLLKGICIILIIITHYSWTDDERLRYLFPFWVDMAVPVFMILSGYVYTKSLERRKISRISLAYEPAFLAERFVRYTGPYLVKFAIEWLAVLVAARIGYSYTNDVSFSLWRSLLCGGIGPGSYYYPLMIQFLFVCPVVSFAVKKLRKRGVVLFGAANLLYELLKWAYGMNAECYSMLLFRYLLLIAFGCFVACEEDVVPNRSLALIFCVGLLFQIVNCCTAYQPIIITYWTLTSVLSALYIIPIFTVIWKGKHIRCRFLERMGKASYHIFLTQSAYYLISRTVYQLIPNRPLQLAVNIVVASSMGLLFYWLDQPINAKLREKTVEYLRRAQTILFSS